MTRPYCVGEIAVAHQNGIPIVPIVLEGIYPGMSKDVWYAESSEPCSREEMNAEEAESGRMVRPERFEEGLFATLAPYGVDPSAIIRARRHLRTLSPIYCDSASHAVAQLLHRQGKGGRTADAESVSLVVLEGRGVGGGVLNASTCPSKPRDRCKCRFLVLGDLSNKETVSVSIYLQLMLQQQMGEPVELALREEAMGEGASPVDEKARMLISQVGG